MDLNVSFDYPKVRFDKENEVVLSTRLKAPSVDDDDRQPLNLVACLDISGSMCGQKMDRMKKTVQVLVDHMTEQDKLGIVVFSTNFTKLASVQSMTSDRKIELKERVSRLYATNSTNISGAMLLGFELLGVRENDLNRVLLLTDGLPNVGETTIPGLVELAGNRPKGVSISTFGFGADHNPELLQSMANAGGGNYYFIENADQISSSFAQELGGLISCYAQNVKIEATFKSGVLDVDMLNKAWEWEYDEEKLIVRIPELIAEEDKNILAKIKLDKRSSSLPRGVTIADVKISYTNLITKKNEVVETKAKIEFVKKGDESQERDHEIVKQEARLMAAEAQKQAAEMATAGNFAGAQMILCSAASSLDSIGDKAWATDLKEFSNCFTPQTYSTSVEYSANSRSYGLSRGRVAGQTVGCSADMANAAQKSMMRSFSEGEQKDDKDDKKDKGKKSKKKGKKYNPMTS